MVVAAAIMREVPAGGEPGGVRMFVASRAYPSELRGLFELPGGKVEPGEVPSEALLREIREELGCELVLGSQVVSGDEDGAWPVLGGRRMLVWLARAQGEPRTREGHLESRWIGEAEVLDLPWIEPDLPIVRAAFAQFSKERALED